MSELRGVQRLVLLGEPGSGKSTAFAQAAAEAGVEMVTARDFVEGVRPSGSTVFIDALEEYRIGEPARERLDDLASALKHASYSTWRIACRSVSLPEDGARALERKLGAFETWLLDSLSQRETAAILSHLGEADPNAFISKMGAVGAGALMSNPATLRLLQTMKDASGDLSTRGALLRSAVLQMSHEINPDFPDLDERPPASQILAAAETASLVLLLSGRSDIWTSGKPAVGAHLVTREHLLEAKVDTAALRFVPDTPLFVGAGGAFHPTHRIVGEYLAGRALARATDPDDERSALPVERALAFLYGAGDRPAPALTGVFAWFVAELANTRHADRALSLVEDDPESVLFYGDPAMLPTPHRRVLLNAIGRRNPWFLNNVAGATAMGGLAGEDIASELIQVALDPKEMDHRRILVLEALAKGRRVESLVPQLQALATDPVAPEWFRRRAIEALLNGDPSEARTRRSLLDRLSKEAGGGPILLQVFLLTGLVGEGANATEVRRVLLDYGGSDDRVMGYLRPLSTAFEHNPMPELFDTALPPPANGRSRGRELAGALERMLAATIAASPELSPERLVAWVSSLGLRPLEPLEDDLRTAVAAWANAEPDRPLALLDAMAASVEPEELWSVGYRFACMTGSPVPDDAREEIVRRLETAAAAAHPDDSALLAIGEVAARLAHPESDYAALHARVMAALRKRPTLHAPTLRWVELSQTKPWEQREATLEAARKSKAEQRRQEDRQWFEARSEGIRGGSETDGLFEAALIALGYAEYSKSAPTDQDRLTFWLGEELAQTVRAGWRRLAAVFPISVTELGASEGRRKGLGLEIIAAAHLAELVAAGAAVDLSLPFAFAALRARYMLGDEAAQNNLASLAIERILRDDEGRQSLLAYWNAALDAGADRIAHLDALETGNGSRAQVLERVLLDRPDLPSPALPTALAAAVRWLDRDTLRTVVDSAQARLSPIEDHQHWAALSYLLDPSTEGDLPRCAADDDGLSAFADFLGLAIEHGLARDAVEGLQRDTILTEWFGAGLAPEDDRIVWSDRQRIVQGAIARLAESPLAAAGEALVRLQADPKLSGWADLLRSKASDQSDLRLDAEFAAPEPQVIARALAGGPPATPADLRAVLREVLAELADDIDTSPTSPWRGYWNRPHGGKNTPKIENDCRDLLTDRLNDRLRPFRIPVAPSTEHRSRNDRRVDLVVVGENAAAVPIEVKRHYNAEIWTAIVDQVVDYAESLKTSGHGIYLVFWFGPELSVPTPPADAAPIKTAKDLQAALQATLPGEMQGKVDIVVLDVSHRATVTETKAETKKAKTAERDGGEGAERPKRTRRAKKEAGG